MRIVSLFLIITLLAGCSVKTNSNLNSALWTQTAAEYKANTSQIFKIAETGIKQALENNSWTAALEQESGYDMLPPAVILDVDETVLDNSPYEAQLIIEGSEFTPESWDNWVSLRRADAIPGAVEFINKAQQMGVTTIFLTNRECQNRKGSDNACNQEFDTIENLKKVGIKNVSSETVLLKSEHENWTSEKKSRREYLADKYRIIMLFGDDLGDFLPDVKKNISPQQRADLVDLHSDKWGKKWFILPNPAYGSWYNILSEPKEQYLQGY